MDHLHKRNYWLHILEGGIYIGGVNFVNTTTILPSMVKSLGGSSDLIALMPSLMIIGFLAPPLFTSHLMERLTHFMPLLSLTGFLQRAFYLFTGLGLIYWTSHQNLCLILVVLTPFLSGLVGGVTITAWQMLLQNTIKPNRRTSMLAIRFIISCIIGMAAGGTIKVILETYPGPKGYGILHLICFAFLTVSFLLFILIREGENKAGKEQLPEKIRMHQNIKMMPKILKENRQLQLFIIMRSFSNGVFLIAGFLGIHTLAATKSEEPFLGELQIFQMIGAILGNIIAGLVGDRFGNKWVLGGALSLFALTSLATPFTSSTSLFYIIFFVFGLSFFSIDIASFALILDMLPGKKRSTSFAIASVFSVISMLTFSFAASRIWRASEEILPLAITASVCLCISLIALFFIKEPRHEAYLSGHER